MDKSGHVMMAGKGAEQFAKEQGLEIVDAVVLPTPGALGAAAEGQGTRTHAAGARGAAERPKARPHAEKSTRRYGTVGAVALDQAGNLAAATSTGGITNKRFGRIGDSPVIGAGTWAENESVAVSATGTGEMFMRSAAAHDIAALREVQGSHAAGGRRRRALEKVRALGGRGGVDRDGPHGRGGVFVQHRRHVPRVREGQRAGPRSSSTASRTWTSRPPAACPHAGSVDLDQRHHHPCRPARARRDRQRTGCAPATSPSSRARQAAPRRSA